MKVRYRVGGKVVGYELESGEVVLGFPDYNLPDKDEEGDDDYV